MFQTEILHAWEQWTGAPSGFYKFLDVDYRKMGSLMGRAKRLKREGAFDGIDFAEVKVNENEGNLIPEIDFIEDAARRAYSKSVGIIK